MKSTSATFASDVSFLYEVRAFSAGLNILNGLLSFIIVSQVQVMYRHLCSMWLFHRSDCWKRNRISHHLHLLNSRLRRNSASRCGLLVSMNPIPITCLSALGIKPTLYNYVEYAGGQLLTNADFLLTFISLDHENCSKDPSLFLRYRIASMP